MVKKQIKLLVILTFVSFPIFGHGEIIDKNETDLYERYLYLRLYSVGYGYNFVSEYPKPGYLYSGSIGAIKSHIGFPLSKRLYLFTNMDVFMFPVRFYVLGPTPFDSPLNQINQIHADVGFFYEILFCFGLSLNYYFLPDTYLSFSINYPYIAKSNRQSQVGIEVGGNSVNFSLHLGKDWWVSSWLGFGVAFGASYLYMNDLIASRPFVLNGFNAVIEVSAILRLKWEKEA